MDCSFCELPEVAERKVFSNELAWAFPTEQPIVPGHLLICPIRHVTVWEEMTKEEMLAVFDLRRVLKNALVKVFGAEGFNSAWNEGDIAGQSVPHVHLHLLPRKVGDTGIWGYEPRSFLYRPGSREKTPQKELIAVAKLLSGKI